MMINIPFMPESASTVSNEVDAVYLLLVGVSAILTLIVALAVVIFAFKYRRRPGNEIPVEYKAYPWLEDAFIGLMFLVFMGLFVAGAKLFFTVQRPPDDALSVYVTGRQWMWKFQHVGGQAEINELHVPKGRAVRLTMASEDVIHSVYVPAFRVKRDVLPSRYSEMWFQATKTGTFHLFCTEYCGTEHSKMIGSVHVMEPGAYQAWLEGKGIGPGSGTGMVAGASPAEAGKQLFTQLGCETCHKPSSSGLGPSLVGVYGTQQPLEGGQRVVADDTYLRESILNPRAKLVAGYQPVMPVFQGQISEDNVVQLITYIRSLSPQAQAGAPGNVAAAPAANAAAPTSTNPATQATASSQP
jgi:cytochrome c oxidase subunit II